MIDDASLTMLITNHMLKRRNLGIISTNGQLVACTYEFMVATCLQQIINRLIIRSGDVFSSWLI